MAFSAFTNEYVNMNTETVSVNTQGEVNTFYFSDTAGSINIALPLDPGQGDMFGVSSIRGGFVITQIAGEQIRVVGNLTTLGVAGNVTATTVGKGIILKYEASDAIWVMQYMAGILSVN